MKRWIFIFAGLVALAPGRDLDYRLLSTGKTCTCKEFREQRKTLVQGQLIRLRFEARNPVPVIVPDGSAWAEVMAGSELKNGFWVHPNMISVHVPSEGLEWFQALPALGEARDTFSAIGRFDNDGLALIGREIVTDANGAHTTW
jgi:hypothetical protein